MRIVLMRHGRSQIDARRWISAKEFGAWIAAYDTGSIHTGHRPPDSAIERAEQCPYVVSSDLARAIASAQALGRTVDLNDRLFREMAMPHGAWRFPRLPARVWTVAFRITWMLGYTPGTESFTQAKRRAHTCAERLIGLAEAHGSILLVGHGFMNRFIGLALKDRGWSSRERPSSDYWASVAYLPPGSRQQS